jgi:20S proteasome subunit alpha 6
VLYEESTRRICLDAKVVKKVRIYRKEGRIEVVLAPESLIPLPPPVEEVKQNGAEQEEKKDNVDLPKGVLVSPTGDHTRSELTSQIEMYDPIDQRFVATSKEKLEELWSVASDEASSVPPLHRAFSAGAGGAAIEVQTSGVESEVAPEEATAQPADRTLTLTVYLNKKRPLSEPKWCRADSADEWLYETFGSRKGFNEAGWRGKLEVVDPDPVSEAIGYSTTTGIRR